MYKPKLAIVGRPNVGKSALFNRLCGKRISIVDEAEGITRDRLYGEAELFGRPFQVVDTGGIDPHAKTPFSEQVKEQAIYAIEEADAIILVVDGRAGITELDALIAKRIRQSGKPVCVAVNKMDTEEQEREAYPFQALGIQPLFPISALHGWQIAELLEALLTQCPEKEAEIEEEKNTSVTIVGRPNVGKSSLINALLNDERCIVSPVPGTTRDHIEIPHLNHTFIDTAGIRRKRAEHEVVDKFAAIRTQEAIARSDLCLFMIDATEGMTTQEKRIASQIEEEGKGCIVLLNKWDLVKGFQMEPLLRALNDACPFLSYCPRLFISAKTGRNLEKILPLIEEVKEERKRRIPTSQLNQLIEKAQQLNHPPRITGKRLRIYYLTQIGVEPPTFTLFVNQPKLMTEPYRRYLIRELRKVYPFTGNPIRFHLRGKVKKGAS